MCSALSKSGVCIHSKPYLDFPLPRRLPIRLVFPHLQSSVHSSIQHPIFLISQERPEQYFEGSARLADPMLCMLDRITAFDSDALFHSSAEKKMSILESGSSRRIFSKIRYSRAPWDRGHDSAVAVVHVAHTDMHKGMNTPVFEPLAVQRDHVWKYRGQVIPENRLITTTMVIVEQGKDERGVYAIANASLWVDGKKESMKQLVWECAL